MPGEKSSYRMTIKLSSARPDAIAEALGVLREQMSDYDQSGEVAATITIESYKEAPIIALLEEFELWLYKYKIGIECEIGLKRPGVRPETMLALRAQSRTPMDDALRQATEEQAEAVPPIITPAPAEPLQLGAPTIDGEYTIEEDPPRDEPAPELEAEPALAEDSVIVTWAPAPEAGRRVTARLYGPLPEAES